MQNLPKIPNYMERLRNLLTKLEAQPHFEIEYLGRQTLDNGREVLAMNVTYEGGYIFMAIDPQTPIFWYKPKDSPTYRVIYADLHVEETSAEDLPPAPEPYEAVPAYSPSRAFGGVAADTESATWHVQSGGRAEVHSEITLTVPKEAQTLALMLPYAEGELTSVLLNEQGVPFTSAEAGKYEMSVLRDGELKLRCIWNMPLDALKKSEEMFRIVLEPLIPAARFEVHAVLEENCGYVFIDSPDRRQKTLFTVNASSPEAHFGSCGLPIKPVSSP